MGMIEEVGTYLAASTGIGTLGVDLFLHSLPETTGIASALFEGAGNSPVFSLGGQVPVFTRGTLDIVVRSTAGMGGFSNPTNARQRAQRIWNRLTAVNNATLSGFEYLRIEPQNEPHLIERDGQGRFVFGATFSVSRRGTTAL